MSADSRGFTLVEMLAVIAIVAILTALLFPALSAGLGAGRSAACKSNLRQMQLAYQMYLDDHKGRFFGYRESGSGETLWYWGAEQGGGAEGSRKLDKSKAKLAPYFEHVGGIEICPALPYHASYFKQKFEIASYGYGINAYLLTNGPALSLPDRVLTIDHLSNPSDTITWADAIQVNTWQAPASADHPMLEEFYYLDGQAPPKFHFRHNGRCNAAFADGSVRSLAPARLDPRCDGRSGYLEPPGQDYWLRVVK